jgi:hypothetical protein
MRLTIGQRPKSWFSLAPLEPARGIAWHGIPENTGRPFHLKPAVGFWISAKNA